MDGSNINMEASHAWVVLAHLLRPQGRKGELLADLLTDFPERFNDHARVYIAKPGFEGKPSEAHETHVVAHWLPTGKNQGRIVLQFADINSISEAELWAGREVIIPLDERLPLDNEENYISDLIGCTVYDGAVTVGLIEDVHFPTTSDGSRRLEDAAPLLTLSSPEGNEVLVPFVKAFLVRIDTQQKRVEMKLPEGLLELNR
jgi:16S rRNA processing protein RimM